MNWQNRETDNYGWIKYRDIRVERLFSEHIENGLTGLDIESILMEIRCKGVRQRATIRPDLHAFNATSETDWQSVCHCDVSQIVRASSINRNQLR